MNRIAVLGCGAMGGLFGGLLGEAGHAVQLIDVDEMLIAAIQAGGLRLTTEAGERRVPLPVGTANRAAAPVELVLVFTKTYSAAAAIESVRHLIGPRTWVLTLQNGLGAGERLTAAVPRARIAIGMTTWPAELLAPGQVASAGRGEVRIWTLSGEEDPMLYSIASVLNLAGLDCRLDRSVVRSIWEKVAFNAAMNSVAAVTGMTVGEMADCPDIRAVVRNVVGETVRAAHAGGVAVDEGHICATIEMAYREHRDHRPSMLQDVLAGRKTEIDAINGAIVAAARGTGTSVPSVELLGLLVRAKEMRYR